MFLVELGGISRRDMVARIPLDARMNAKCSSPVAQTSTVIASAAEPAFRASLFTQPSSSSHFLQVCLDVRESVCQYVQHVDNPEAEVKCAACPLLYHSCTFSYP